VCPRPAARGPRPGVRIRESGVAQPGSGLRIPDPVEGPMSEAVRPVEIVRVGREPAAATDVAAA
jgi:hypothetical protein